MKKALVFMLAILVLSFSFSAIAATYVPTDGDFQNVWGRPGADIGNATSAGVPLKWTKADSDGNLWAARLSYSNPVKLDGLVIKLKNVVMPDDNAGFAIGFTDSAGAWVDSKGIFLLNNNQKLLDKTSLDHGYIMSKTGADMGDKQPKFVEPTPTLKKIGGDITISFKKNSDGTWDYNFNGQVIKIQDSAITSNLKDVNNCYLAFSPWAEIDLSFTVANVNSANVPAASSSKASSSSHTSSTQSKSSSSISSSIASTASASSSTVSDSSTNTTVSADTSSTASEAQSVGSSSTKSTSATPTNNMMLPIIIVVVLLLACGVGIFFILKMKKTK